MKDKRFYHNHWRFLVYHGLYQGAEKDVIFISRMTPINRLYHDKMFASEIYSMINTNNAAAFGEIVQEIIKESYFINIYSVFVLVYLLFHAKKDARLVAIDGLYTLINQERIDVDIFAKHCLVLVEKNAAPFSRFIESIVMLSEYEGLTSSFLYQLIQHILTKVYFKDKQPTGFKKLVELYYQLLGKLNKNPDDDVINNLDKLLLQASGLKTIVNKN